MATEPINKLQDLISNGTPRKRRARPTEDGKLIEMVEEQSLALFQMKDEDIISIVIDYLEQDVLSSDIPEWQPQPTSSSPELIDTSEEVASSSSENESLIS